MNKKLEELFSKLDEYEIKRVKWLRRTRPPLYTILRHVSNSGMFRLIDVYAITNNKPVCLTALVGKLAGYERDNKREGLRVGGCGMDMGFSVVYNFSRAIFPTGFRYRTHEHHRNNDPSPRDPDGGYALEQRWL